MLFIHFKTLFSFAFYKRLAQLSGRQTIGFVAYLFFVAVLVCFFFTGSVISKNLPVFLKNFPQVTFEKGVLTAPDKPVSAPIPGTDFKIVFDAAAQMPPTAQELLQQNTLAWIHQNQLYIPSTTGLQQQTIPDTVTFTSTPETLEKYKSSLSASLRLTLFILSLFFIALTLLMDFILALGVALFFNLWRQAHLPRITLVKLAAFLLGPLTVLWLVRLWINIPLFGLAQFILCVIYLQQIFNVYQGEPHEN